VKWQEFLSLEDAVQDKACRDQDLLRAMDPRRIRHFQASIHGPMTGMTRAKRGIARRPGLWPKKPKESLPAPRELYGREKEKGGSSDAKSSSELNSTHPAQEARS